MSRYQFIRACTEPWPVQLLCRVLAVSPTGYYQWQQRPARTTAQWQEAAQAAFTRHARRYGTLRLRAELRAEGHAVGRYALRSWLHRNDLRARSIRLNAPARPWPTQPRWWSKTGCSASRPPPLRTKSESATSLTSSE